MMVTIHHNQSLLDIAVQYTGYAENAFLIAKENSLAVHAPLVAGDELVVPAGLPINKVIVEYYKSKRIVPATADTGETSARLEGIGYWKIGTEFKVS